MSATLFSLQKTAFDTEIQEFRDRLHQNITKPATHSLGCTFILIESRGEMGEPIFAKFVVFVPFKYHGESPSSYLKTCSRLYMRDLRLRVDESVYLSIYTEMVRTQNIVVGKFDNESLSFEEMYGKALVIKANFSKSTIEEYLGTSFLEWYNKERLNCRPEFEIELTNPDGYYLRPFPVKQLIFSVNLLDNNNENFLKQK
jgi:hypothetical protein